MGVGIVTGAPKLTHPSFVRPSLFAFDWQFSVWAGWALILYSVLHLSGGDLRAMGPGLAMITFVVVIGELRPVVMSHTFGNPVSISSAFIFAVLYLWGLAPAILLQALTVIISELLQRKQLWRLVFNVGQYCVSIAAAASVLIIVGVHPSPIEPMSGLSGRDLPWILGSWVVYHVVNLALVAGLSRTARQTWWESFSEDFWFYTFSTFAVLALSPLVVLVEMASDGSWGLLPLLLLPLLAVHKTAQMSREQEHSSLHDVLTDLPNRTLLARRTKAAIEDDRRKAATDEATGVALLLLDLDRFKEVNDTLGHPVGDDLLRVVAHRLSAAVRPGDVVARLGGDEFGILLPGVGSPAAAAEVAERLRLTLAEPFRMSGVLVDLDSSVGVAVYPEHGRAFEELLRKADVAMYAAKAADDGTQIYDPTSDPNSEERLGAVTALREAIAAHQLELHYQPKTSLPGGDVVGVEALVRWRHPERGLVPPDEFIPLAERTGLINTLTDEVLDLALRQAHEWWTTGLRIPVAVNVSMRDLQRPDFARRLMARLDHYDVVAGALMLEVTESILGAEPTIAVATLRELSAVGVRCSLDDFGTGYSSLVRLERLPVVELKIDRSFVRQLDDPRADPSMVRSVIGLAHGLDLLVVAEGVETDVAHVWLTRLGCDVVQGWYIARAMPGPVATQWLRKRCALPAPGGDEAHPGPTLYAVGEASV